MSGRQQKPDVASSLMLVELLKSLKSLMDYRMLSQHTGIPVSTLTRYVTNKTLPRGRKTLELINKLLNMEDIKTLISERVVVNGEDVDISRVVAESHLMKLAAIYLMREYAGHRIDCVLALDNPGLVLATAFGLQTMKETYYSETNDVLADHGWAEIRYRISGIRTSSRLYIPKTVLNKNVLIVVGVFDSLAPLTQVRDRIVNSKGDVVGVCGLAALKELRKQVKPYQLGRVFFFAEV
jgi:adenine/guanine phosphoribosyltransferase-like PRPP-binding protein